MIRCSNGGFLEHIHIMCFICLALLLSAIRTKDNATSSYAATLPVDVNAAYLTIEVLGPIHAESKSDVNKMYLYSLPNLYQIVISGDDPVRMRSIPSG